MRAFLRRLFLCFYCARTYGCFSVSTMNSFLIFYLFLRRRNICLFLGFYGAGILGCFSFFSFFSSLLLRYPHFKLAVSLF